MIRRRLNVALSRNENLTLNKSTSLSTALFASVRAPAAGRDEVDGTALERRVPPSNQIQRPDLGEKKNAAPKRWD